MVMVSTPPDVVTDVLKYDTVLTTSTDVTAELPGSKPSSVLYGNGYDMGV
jgi:hypothetical protein